MPLPRSSAGFMKEYYKLWTGIRMGVGNLRTPGIYSFLIHLFLFLHVH